MDILVNFMFLKPALRYNYVILTNKIHTFYINVLIQSVVFPAFFEQHVFIIRKTNCTCIFYNMIFMHLFTGVLISP